LFENIDNLPGSELEYKSKYYAHLVANPDITREFMKLPLFYKMSWVTGFLHEKM
jgi:hypothetical protein